MDRTAGDIGTRRHEKGGKVSYCLGVLCINGGEDDEVGFVWVNLDAGEPIKWSDKYSDIEQSERMTRTLWETQEQFLLHSDA